MKNVVVSDLQGSPPHLTLPHGERELPPIKTLGGSSTGLPAPPAFHSILFAAPDHRPQTNDGAEPEFFGDLNLDQIVDAITARREEYDLKPFFHLRLTTPAAIAYRHEVMRDLEEPGLLGAIQAFADRMRAVRGHLAFAEKADYRLQKERWFLDAAELYGDAVEDLRRSLEQAGLASRGLQGFRRYLAQYLGGDAFQSLRKETKALLTDLTAIQYCVLIDGGTVTVQPYNAEADYSTVIEEAFARFRQGAVKDYRVKFPPPSGMNHVEAMILERVALLHPQVFEVLATFCATHRGFLDSTVVAFDREIQFYAAWLEYTAAFRRAGLAFCYPQISAHDKNISSRGSFDLALAGRLIRDNAPVVLNDFHVHGRERILVVTGPNQGGKTTFARTFGQLHYLASLGCPVPGTEARLFLCDRLRVLFERREDVTTLRGKLEDDLIRLHRLLAEATPNSLLIFNEVFSSTTVADAVLLSQNVMERLTRLDAVGVWVTFLDELSSLNEKAVSLVAGVVPEDPTRRTFKIERRPANGLAYALAIAEKHRLTYAQLKERLRP